MGWAVSNEETGRRRGLLKGGKGQRTEEAAVELTYNIETVLNFLKNQNGKRKT